MVNSTYYQANRERILAAQRAWKKANPEKQKEYHRRYAEKKKRRQAEVLLAASEVVAKDARKKLSKEPKNVPKQNQQRVDESVSTTRINPNLVTRRVPEVQSTESDRSLYVVLSRRAAAARRICDEEGIEAESVRQVIVEINGVRFTYM